MSSHSTQRIDPASLPAAGRTTYHDSLGNLDYRYVQATTSQSPRKLRQKAQWDFHSDEYLRHKPDPIKPPPARPPALAKPDHFYVDDIHSASPSTAPGLTLLQPVPDPSSPSKALAQAQAGLTPSRSTNPLQPDYPWPGPGSYQPRIFPFNGVAERQQQQQGGDGHAGPHDSGGSGGQQQQQQQEDAVPGSRTGPYTRTRRDPYSSYDYSDVTSSTSPVKARMVRGGREKLAPIDTRPLGMWTQGGDTGKYIQTHRQPTNPNVPSYNIHGRQVADDDGLGRSRRLVPQVSSERRRWKAAEAEEVGLVAKLGELGVHQNQNARSPLRKGLNHNLAYVHQYRPTEVAPANV